MTFEPIPPARLADRLAEWIEKLGERVAVGIDGPSVLGAARDRPAGASAVAAEVGDRLVAAGRPVLRASTRWWWRAPSLRLEQGRHDVDSLVHGWLDRSAVNRELLDPFASGEPVLTRLRDPDSGRSVRDRPEPTPERAVLLLDGPFLAAGPLHVDRMVHLAMSGAALERLLPPEDRWWAEGFGAYAAEYRPGDSASVVIAYEHPHAPAVRWPG